MQGQATPTISVVIPTFRRPELLPRAVESVLAQTCADWELIVSNDENAPNPSHEYVEQVARRDNRVRLIANPNARGQAGNLNNAMAAARGEWIKPVYDDDRLLPDCLARMLASVAHRPEAVIARCLSEFHTPGGVRRTPRGRRARLEALTPMDALLAVFVQDVEIGTPTQVMVKRSVVQSGTWFPHHDRIIGGVDELWYTQLLQQGDLLLVNEVLAASYQTGHLTITSALTPEAFDEEILLLREMQYPLVNALSKVPSLSVAKQALLIERALWRLSHGRVVDAARMLSRARELKAWGMAWRWALRRMLPGRFEVVPRVVLAA